MDEGGFDLCECIFSHEQAMQRLISLLRSTQSACTDSECFGEFPQLPSTPNVGSNFYLLLIGWLVLAMALFFLRPSSLRRRSGDGKPDRQGPSNQPPPGGPVL
ncbi:small integral membrane protein 14-like [Ornithodoros turicata]|uniref:small integral membrane protein 14-like n=1 Tax=Ornithodoros turicata TaxID=34597 RepID=UPI0031396974